MNQKLGILSAATLLGALVIIVGCNKEEPAQPVQTAPPAQVAPAVPAVPAVPTPAAPTQVAAAPAAPPATPLIPISDEPEEEEVAPKKNTGVGNIINKKLPGAETTGDELIGNYKCSVDSKALSIGPLKAPPFGCKIYRIGDGSLKVASTSEGTGSFKGNVKDHTVAGFFIKGKYEVAGNSLTIRIRMTTSGAGVYSGRGEGKFNEENTNKIKYKMKMTRQ